MVHLATSRDSAAPPPDPGLTGHGPQPPAGPVDHGLLHLLRTRAIGTRLAPRVDPFRYCALIAAAPDLAAEACADGLLHVLPQALGRPPLVRRPGGAGPSFDEAWIVGLVEGVRRDDAASIRFALASRVPKPFRRPLVFLVHGLARRLDEGCPRTT